MKKIRKSGGFTLVETLASMVILVMLIGVISVGVDTAVRAYQTITFSSESDLLSATIQTVLSDILRYSKCEVSEETSPDTGILITNGKHGITKGGFFLEEGRIKVLPGSDENGEAREAFLLVNEGVYTSMKITEFHIEYKDGLFFGDYVIESNSGKFKKTRNYAFRTLKAK